jgi:hypothetical protein
MTDTPTKLAALLGLLAQYLPLDDSNSSPLARLAMRHKIRDAAEAVKADPMTMLFFDTAESMAAWSKRETDQAARAALAPLIRVRDEFKGLERLTVMAESIERGCSDEFMPRGAMKDFLRALAAALREALDD